MRPPLFDRSESPGFSKPKPGQEAQTLQEEKQDPSDLDLVQRALRSDAQAQDAVLQRLTCVRRILTGKNVRAGRPLSDSELDDLVQDTLLAVWRKLDSYAGEGVLEAWVYRFSVYEFMVALRKRRRLPQLLEELRDEQSPSEPSSADSVPEWDFESVHRGLEDLGPPDSVIIALKHFEGLTFDEIAQRRGESINTTKTRYYRGLNRLRRKLSGEPGIRGIWSEEASS